MTDLPDLSPAEIRDLLRYMTPEERAFVEQVLADDPLPWRPLPGPQALAYFSTADIVGYGGAAGGGKTDLAIGKALTMHRKVAIFREHATELTPVYDRINEIIGRNDARDRYGRYILQRYDGVPLMIEFGSLANPGDETKHQGHPKDLLVLEEAANLREAAARFLMGWVRTVVVGQHAQTLMTFNPPTKSEGRWIIDYFAPWIDKHHVLPADPGELRWFVTVAGRDHEVADNRPRVMVGGRLTTDFDRREYREEDILLPKSRTFIPARVSDNPYLLGTAYIATLQALPEPLRSQMLYGDFTAGLKDDEWQVIPTAWVEAAMQRWTKRDRKTEMASVGVDVARGGDNDTCIARRHVDWWFDEPLTYPGANTPDGPHVAGLTIAAVRDRAPIHIDVVGVGSSPYDFLVQARQQVLGINGAERCDETDKSGRLRFSNVRSRDWWRMRELLDPESNLGVALPPDKRLLRELTAPRWRLVGGKVYVESREELLDPKRLGWSPDLASAYILASYDTPKIHEVLATKQPAGLAHDPYEVAFGEPGAGSYGGHDPYS